MQSTHALMCVRAWSLMAFVKDTDIRAVVALLEVDEEEDLKNDWDAINI